MKKDEVFKLLAGTARFSFEVVEEFVFKAGNGRGKVIIREKQVLFF